MLSDTRFKNNAQRLINKKVLAKELAGIFVARTNAEWLASMEAHAIPAGEINSVRDALNSPIADAIGLIASAPHSTLGGLKTMMPSFLLSDTPVRGPIGAPLLGEHTSLILREWARFDSGRIDAMLDAGTAVETKGQQ